MIIIKMEKDQDKILSDVTTGEYKYGFYSDIEMDRIPKGLSEEVVRLYLQRKMNRSGYSNSD